jgi:hypothetical protein
MRRRRMNQSQSSSSKEGMKISQRRQQATATFLHPRLRYKYEFRLVGFKVNLTDATQNWRWSSANCDTVSLQYQCVDLFGLAPSRRWWWVVMMCVVCGLWSGSFCVCFLALALLVLSVIPALLFAANAALCFVSTIASRILQPSQLPCFLSIPPYLVS